MRRSGLKTETAKSHRHLQCAALAVLVTLLFCADAPAKSDDLPTRAKWALRHAVIYFRRSVAIEGGYLWKYSADLSRREGEGVVTGRTVWVQPPGTPAIGLSFLLAYETTGEKLYLDAAQDVGGCLLRGQLRSGGWADHIDFDPELRGKLAYRIEPPGKKKRNYTSLDDNKTQSALRFMMRLDRALQFKDRKIHESARFALDALLKAQHKNGGFSQVFSGPSDPARHSAKKANYPAAWRTPPRPNRYWNYYTLNDNLLPDVLSVLFDAEEIYKEKRLRDAALKIGDFLILAQMPDPQPGWAQQYNFDMQPEWARRFEPAAITGGESQGAMRTLLRLYRKTGERRFLEPIPRALAYYRESLLPNGQLARFYELRTNKPLYFTRKYALTHSDADMPTHYSFKIGSGLDRIDREYQQLKKMTPRELDAARRPATVTLTKQLASQARNTVDALDDQGRWIDKGGLRYDKKYKGPVIDCRTFNRNVKTLCDYLAAQE